MHNCTLQTGKLHFGVILGWSVVSSIVVWLVVNNMAGTENPESQSLGLYSCCCLLGYCLLPMVVFALLALIIPRYKLLPSVHTVLKWRLRSMHLLVCKLCAHVCMLLVMSHTHSVSFW